MSEISHYARAGAERLQADCQLAAFRKDEAARIIQDAMDWEINSMLTMLRTHPNAVHLNILRGQFLLTREQARVLIACAAGAGLALILAPQIAFAVVAAMAGALFATLAMLVTLVVGLRATRQRIGLGRLVVLG